MKLHPAEKELIDNIRNINYGSVEIEVQNGLPYLIKKTSQAIKITAWSARIKGDM